MPSTLGNFSVSKAPAIHQLQAYFLWWFLIFLFPFCLFMRYRAFRQESDLGKCVLSSRYTLSSDFWLHTAPTINVVKFYDGLVTFAFIASLKGFLPMPLAYHLCISVMQMYHKPDFLLANRPDITTSWEKPQAWRRRMASFCSLGWRQFQCIKELLGKA